MDINYVILLIGMTLVTYLCRRLLLSVPEHMLTKKIKDGLALVPIGIYAALVFPSLFLDELEFRIKPLYLLSALLCLLTMKITNNFFLSFCIGMGTIIVGSIAL